jgi:hypothetical protein
MIEWPSNLSISIWTTHLFPGGSGGSLAKLSQRGSNGPVPCSPPKVKPTTYCLYLCFEGPSRARQPRLTVETSLILAQGRLGVGGFRPGRLQRRTTRERILLSKPLLMFLQTSLQSMLRTSATWPASLYQNGRRLRIAAHFAKPQTRALVA